MLLSEMHATCNACCACPEHTCYCAGNTQHQCSAGALPGAAAGCGAAGVGGSAHCRLLPVHARLHRYTPQQTHCVSMQATGMLVCAVHVRSQNSCCQCCRLRAAAGPRGSIWGCGGAELRDAAGHCWLEHWREGYHEQGAAGRCKPAASLVPVNGRVPPSIHLSAPFQCGHLVGGGSG